MGARHMYQQLFASQLISYVVGGFLVGWAAFTPAWMGRLIDPSAIAPIALGAIILVLATYLPQVVHELAEINDQLAGRSKEFHELLKGERG